MGVKALYGLGALMYACSALTYVWPYLSQVWAAYRQGRPVGEVPRPATNKLIAGALAFIGGVMWTWLYFRQ